MVHPGNGTTDSQTAREETARTADLRAIACVESYTVLVVEILALAYSSATW